MSRLRPTLIVGQIVSGRLYISAGAPQTVVLGWPAVSRRCQHRAAPGSHHLICGLERNNVSASRLALHRIAVCGVCHSEITHHVLVPLGTPAPRELAARVMYSRRAT